MHLTRKSAKQLGLLDVGAGTVAPRKRGRRRVAGSSDPEMPVIEAQIVPPDRYRSETERRFSALLDSWQAKGHIQCWEYEPCKGLYFTARTSYTPDFWTIGTDGRVTIYEVKGGFIRDKDRQKLKIAAAMYWYFPFILAQEIRGVWNLTRIPAG